jgi:nicotinamidase-related amidase
MTSETIRDPLTDPLLTPENCTLVVIDYQPRQVDSIKSMDQELLVRNVVSVARTAETFGLPVVLSTVNVANGQGPTVRELKEVLAESVESRRVWRCDGTPR